LEYKQIGKTGYKTSVIGLGTEFIYDVEDSLIDSVVNEAINQGINFIDMVVPTEQTRRGVGKAIKGKRDKLIIQGHICSTDINKRFDISRDLDIVKKYFNMLLDALQIDYVDFGMLFFIDSEKNFNDVFNSEIIEYALDLKKKGIVRHLGASSHNPVTALKVVETGIIDLLMFPVNAAFDVVNANTDLVVDEMRKDLIEDVGDSDRTKLYRLCEQKNFPITAMKPFGCGKLLKKEFSPFSEPMTVGQCLQYALTRPGVVSAMVGCSTPEEVLECIDYFDLSEEKRDYTKTISSVTKSFDGSCMYCNHCEPCPSAIHIAKVNRALDIALLDVNNIPDEIRGNYNALESHGSDCIQCGNCEDRCPFSVTIIENMRKVSEIFGR